MKRVQFLFGVAILGAAVVLAGIILFKPRERGGDGWAMRGGSEKFGGEARLDWSAASAARTKRVKQAVVIGHVEPERSGDPDLLVQARQVEALAKRRLRSMSEQLSLTKEQEAKIFPLLARSSPEFDGSLAVVDGDGRRSVGRLTRDAADGGIHELLNPRQREGLIESIAEEDLWWADVIARLERDLHRSTDPIEEPVPSDEPNPGDIAPAPHPRRNLFELQKEG